MSATTQGARIQLSCPHCSRTVTGKRECIGKTVRCPKCKKIFRIAAPAPLPPISVNPPSLADSYRRKYRLERFIGPAFNLFLIIGISVVFLIGILKAVMYAQHHPDRLDQLGVELAAWFFPLTPFLLMLLYFLCSVHKIRATRHILYYGIWLGVPITLIFLVCLGGFTSEGIFGLVAGLFFTSIVAIPWYYLGHWPAHWITPFILAMLFWKMRCPHCHETHEFRDRWSCSCGYSDHRDNRHLLLFSCPKCQCRIGNVDCPRCESTILL